MSGEARIVAAAGLDRRGVVGSAGVVFRRAPAGPGFPAEALAWRRMFPEPYPAFRRLDPLARAVAVAARALGLEEVLPEDERDGTALVLASRHGCLETDLRFQEGLSPGGRLEPALFPYTLQSSALAETAIRYRLRGPTLSISVEPGGERAGLLEARALFDEACVQAALVCLGDVLPERAAAAVSEPARLSFAALLLRREGAEILSFRGASGLEEWIGDLWERFG